MPFSAVGGNLQATGEYANMHSYQEDLRELVKELDTSLEKTYRLRMMIVEKDNFLEGLQKRERLLRTDMSEHKHTLAALAAHVDAVEARIERLKQQRQVAEVSAQKHQFDMASMKLETEVESVKQVSGALDARLERLGAGIAQNMKEEVQSMRQSLQPTVAAGHEADSGAAAAAKRAGSFNPMTMMQESASSRLRGANRKRTA
jgi:predicted  nucleic acid-binding Zn-ribbon protein